MMRSYHTLGDLIHGSLKGFSLHMRVLRMNCVNVTAILNEKHNALNRNTSSSYHSAPLIMFLSTVMYLLIGSFTLANKR